MHSQIFTISHSASPSARLDAVVSYCNLNLNSPDLLLLDSPDTAIGIDQVRLVQHFLATYPKNSAQKTVVFLFAEALTLPAQHAFLKTLEEPPSYASINLLVSNHRLLLPTIVSRCLISSLTHSAPDLPSNPDLDLPTTPSAAIALTDKLTADKTLLPSTLNSLIINQRRQLLSRPSSVHLYNLTLLLYSQKLLSQNINPKLVLDRLFFSLKR